MGSAQKSLEVRLENDVDEKTKLQNEQPSAPAKVKTVDDFLQLGLYTLYAGITCEFVVFNMLSNMIYMYDKWRPQNACVPELEYQFLSANVEFDYLCGEGKTVKNSISIQMFGILMGTIIFGQLSDSFGRRTVCINFISCYFVAHHFKKNNL
ncbi:unnamed protein product [Toxocara canis]|uniref:MFS domain-containing protein n=1 Tax=Toxocara canis TaxID=6265 RepID=A0A183TZW4_TOXCA|nr:unnamed protein product [Toxocara canis]